MFCLDCHTCLDDRAVAFSGVTVCVLHMLVPLVACMLIACLFDVGYRILIFHYSGGCEKAYQSETGVILLVPFWSDCKEHQQESIDLQEVEPKGCANEMCARFRPTFGVFLKHGT